MRKTHTALIALGLAIGLPAAGLAEADAMAWQDEARDQLAAAGFEDAQILPQVQVARVTDEAGSTYYVFGGESLAAVGPGLDRPDMDADAMLGEEETTDMIAEEEPEFAEDVEINPQQDLAGEIEMPPDPDIAPDADLAADIEEPGADPEAPAMFASLEDQLREAGITDFEIIEQAMVAEVMVAEGAGEPLYVLFGLDAEPGEQ